MNRRALRRVQQTLESWEEGLARLGSVIVAFQRIDESLARAIGSMVARERNVGDIMVTELSFRGRVATFQALFLHRTKFDKLPEHVREVVKRIVTAEQIRNKLVHSDWDANTRKPTTIRRTKSALRGKRGLDRTLEELRPTDLEEIAASFEGIADDVWFVMGQYLPKFADRMQP
jgi:hypothetical protein